MNLSRELSHHQAFQTHSLNELGVVSWMHGTSPVHGEVFRSPQPWLRADGVQTIAPAVDDGASFRSVEPPALAVAPQQKDASVADLRRQLGAAPEVIVEDLQPIEETIAVPTVALPETVQGLPTSVQLNGYLLAGRLLLLTDLPRSFNEPEALDKLAISLAKALLKQDISDWSSGQFVWPGKLKNRYLIGRKDWALGGFEQFLSNQLAGQTPQWIILAGEQCSQFFETLPDDHALKLMPNAKVDSLPQMLRIPELRKEAWKIMQSSFR
ncbi:hypothetical protein [Marinomonas gallaica]|uniref:hypothetical protein n=1 Tax=Marinomonas gallaica TaxID=1806667 RepID=UPI0009ECCA44|nr:hypothetical protein [Marinomonas gallaica]